MSHRPRPPHRPLMRAAHPARAALVCCVIIALAALTPAVAMVPSPPAGTATPAVAAAPVTIATAPAGGAGPVSVAVGEAPGAVAVHWDAGDATGPAAVDLYAAGAAAPAPPLRSVPVAAGLDGVALFGLDPARIYQAVVTVTGASTGSRRLGPSLAFRVGPAGPVVAAGPDTRPAGGAMREARTPCLGAGYGVGRVTVDGWAGVQGSYCLPPGFTSGTGAFCIDHGLDYPSGAYRWASSPAGAALPLRNQYGTTADPASTARLAWVLSTHGATTDPARAVAVGVIAHAVMGDYPGLATADLDPPRVAIGGGDPGAIAADVGAMWAASRAAGPYQAAIRVGPGPYADGGRYRGTVTVTAASGAPLPGALLSAAGSAGAQVSLDAPVTGSGGSIGFSFTPRSPTFALAVAAGPLPADSLTVWTPQRPPVAVQRVVTAGAPAGATATVRLAATQPARVTLVKLSTDPAVPVTTGFAFDIDIRGPAGSWTTVARRRTAPDGSMTPVGGLAPGDYRVTETGHPAAFEPGGPWAFTLAAGEQAEWKLTDAPRPQPVRIVKAGDDPAVPVGAGAVFALESVPPGGAAPVAAGTLTTGAGGVTPTVLLAPGRYRVTETTPPAGYEPAPPLTVTVTPVGAAGPQMQTVTVTDHAVAATLRLTKTNALDGSDVAGALVRVTRLVPGGPASTVGEWSSAAGPRDIRLAPGRYQVQEERPPAGYLADPAPRQVDLQPGQTLEVTLADRPLPAAPLAAATPPAPPAPAPPAPAPPVVGTPAAPPAAVLGPAAPGAQLAFTGLPLWRWLLVAAAALGAGVTLVAATMRQRPRPAPGPPSPPQA